MWVFMQTRCLIGNPLSRVELWLGAGAPSVVNLKYVTSMRLRESSPAPWTVLSASVQATGGDPAGSAHTRAS